jgi:hypothetical protein
MERFKYDSVVFFLQILCACFVLLFVYAYSYVEFKSSQSLTWIKAAFNDNATALWWPSWWESVTAGHNFGKGPSNDYSIKFGSN